MINDIWANYQSEFKSIMSKIAYSSKLMFDLFQNYNLKLFNCFCYNLLIFIFMSLKLYFVNTAFKASLCYFLGGGDNLINTWKSTL